MNQGYKEQIKKYEEVVYNHETLIKRQKEDLKALKQSNDDFLV